MLAKPSVNDIMGKIGTRYEVALAVAKRARQISDERIETGDPDISDPVDVASKEIDSGKVVVAKQDHEVNDIVVDEEIEAGAATEVDELNEVTETDEAEDVEEIVE